MYEEILGRVYETVVGRLRQDLQRYGTRASGLIGKHIVGTGEDAHLTTKVYFDLLKPHVVLIAGKRGTGKSYFAGVVLEELMSMEPEFLRRTAAVVFDPVGIYWSLKRPNSAQQRLLKEWELEPRGFENLKVYVPLELKHAYEEAGIPVDGVICIAPRQFEPEDWSLAFNLERTGELAVVLENHLAELCKHEFGLEELAESISSDQQVSASIKAALLSLIRVARNWGVFEKHGIGVQDVVKPGEVSVIDLSRVRGEEWGVRSLIAAWLTRQVYRERVLARKEEELARVEQREPKRTFPLTWLIFEEAHNFVPADYFIPSSQPIITVARQGREPGVGLIVITQMPNRVHAEVLAQTDVVISFRLTSKEDLNALHAVMQTYMAEELWQYINKLPRNPGAAIILDDTLEKVYTVQTRPRLSHHAGGTASLV